MTNFISLLGSTGSIGTQSLDVIRCHPGRYKVVALAGGRNLARLAAQVREFMPDVVSIQDADELPAFRERLNVEAPQFNGTILCGREGLNTVATLPEIDTVVVGLVGLIGLEPSIAALQAGKKLLTANKETFVAGGHLVKPFLKRVIPVDSEHSAIFQCLGSRSVTSGDNYQQPVLEDVAQLYLTASGGPFRQSSLEAMATVTPELALKHPNWVMGPRISIDSATMMNKGFEVIEAHWLFGIPYDKIAVITHPESIVHGAIRFVDGSIIAQMGATDMRGPIQYALSYPQRLPNPIEAVHLDLLSLSQLNFEKPDAQRFPCLRLAYEAGRLGGGATTVLNSADEELVQAFLDGRIGFLDIPRYLEAILGSYIREVQVNTPSLEEILSLDTWARDWVRRQLAKVAFIPA